MRHRQRQIFSKRSSCFMFSQVATFWIYALSIRTSEHKGRWYFATNPDFTLTLRRASGSALTSRAHSCRQQMPAPDSEG